MSLFITFEGGEGSGKSTQAKILAESLQNSGKPSLLVHEPGTTKLGEYLREWLKKDSSTARGSYASELLLFAAARAELVAKVIKPELKAGKIVISDRYKDSTLAYQGYGRGIKLKQINVINELATDNVEPTLTFLLDCPPEVGLSRVGLSRLDDKQQNRIEPTRPIEEGTFRFEMENSNFHKRVREGYLKMAAAEPKRWHVVDATRPVKQITTEIWGKVQQLLEEKNSELNQRPKASLL